MSFYNALTELHELAEKSSRKLRVKSSMHSKRTFRPPAQSESCHPAKEVSRTTKKAENREESLTSGVKP